MRWWKKENQWNLPSNGGDGVKKFKLHILTPKGDFYNDEAEAVSITTIYGRIQILANHIPYISGVKASSVKINNGDEEKYCSISEGLLHFLNNNLSIFADTAKWKRKEEEP